METVSLIILPIIVLSILITAFIKKVNIYDKFLEGAKEGLIMTFKIAPNIFAMIFAVNIFIKSSFLSDIFSFITPVLTKMNLTSEIIPMCFLRSISGTSTLGIMANIFETYGPDSIMGYLASIIQGSSDTTLYVIALYFGSVGITKSRYALKAGLFADLIGIIVSFILVYFFFST
ncbi:MAG: spore maturation protein [Tenericutes bacterium]|nr:spore maturation protein [Mycoplasmatota bacterium]